jgi:hypothetical protein
MRPMCKSNEEVITETLGNGRPVDRPFPHVASPGVSEALNEDLGSSSSKNK